MDKRKIYFEHVPLEVVKKIAEEEQEVIKQKETEEPPRKIRKTKLLGGKP